MHEGSGTVDDRAMAEARNAGGEIEERAMRRREFLERAAALAGLTGMASLLPADVLLARAARGRRSALPTPRNMPVDHVVVLMMENRSFDHYFGWLANADGDQHQSFRRGDGTTGEEVDTLHFRDLPGSADHQGCGHPDPGHGWNAGRVQLERGFLADGSGNDEFALTYFDRGDLGFIHAAGSAYTVYDRFFCSAMTSTWPNRYYKWSATAGGRKGNDVPLETLGNQWETIFDRALRGNPLSLPLPGKLTARYYASDLPFGVVWGARALPWINPLVRFYADCLTGTLPNISFVDPPFRDGGGFDGNSADEHPHGDVRLGQAFMADVVRAFVQSPCYRRGALFVIYDEWGGFFDHVLPPRVPDDRASTNPAEDWGQLGFRIPAICVSPWTRNRSSSEPARVVSGQYAHESILKLISYRFGLGDLNLRHASTANIGESFDWEHPVYDRPDLPDPTYLVSKPCLLGGGDLLAAEARSAHESDLAGLVDMAERIGAPVFDSTVEQLFRLPNSVRRAYRPRGR